MEQISIYLQGEHFYITKEFARLYKLRQDQVISEHKECIRILRGYKKHVKGRSQLINQFSLQKKN